MTRKKADNKPSKLSSYWRMKSKCDAVLLREKRLHELLDKANERSEKAVDEAIRERNGIISSLREEIKRLDKRVFIPLDLTSTVQFPLIPKQVPFSIHPHAPETANEPFPWHYIIWTLAGIAIVGVILECWRFGMLGHP